MLNGKSIGTWGWVTSAVLALVGCSGDSSLTGPDSEATAIARQALTADQQRILGWEAPTSADWSTNAGTISASATFSQGVTALAIDRPQAWTEICSTQLSSLRSVGRSVSFQLYMEESTPSFGDVRVLLRAPSLGLWNAELPPVSIQNKAPGVFHTITSALGAHSGPLSSTYNDLRICVVINAESGRYVLDDLRFSGLTTSASATASSTGSGGTQGATSGETSTSAGGVGGNTGSGGTDGGEGGTGGDASTGGNGGTSGSGGTGGDGGTGGTGGTGGATSGDLSPCIHERRGWDQLVARFPRGTGIHNVALGAQGGKLEIHDGVAVRTAGGSAFGNVTALSGSGLTELGANAESGNILSGLPVNLRSNSMVHGFVKSGGTLTMQTGAQVQQGTLENFDHEPYVEVGIPYRFPETYDSDPVVITNGSSVSLPAGAYGSISVQAQSTLALGPGEFYLDGLSIEPGSHLRIDNAPAGVSVFVRGQFSLKVTPEYTAPDKFNVLFGIIGTGPVTLEQNFRGTLVAPQADVVLPTATISAGHYGSIVARSIVAHQHTDFYFRPYERDAQDCSEIDPEGLGGILGCPAKDTDGDGIPDCVEENDDNDWTDSQECNSVRVRLAEPCHPDEELLHDDVDSLDEVEACLENATEVEQGKSHGGAKWPQIAGSDICSLEYGLGIDWAQCRTAGQIHVDGVIKIDESGTQCFQLIDGSTADGPNPVIAALFVGDSGEGITALDGVVCMSLPIGIHPVRWFYEFTGPSESEFRVATCTTDPSTTCDPLLDTDWGDRRGQLFDEIDDTLAIACPCNSGQCKRQCPCDSGDGTCENDSDCTPPAVCVEGNGPKHGKNPGESVCEDPLCNTMAPFLGCGFEGARCGMTCSPRTPCSQGCPAGEVCGVGKGPLFGDTVSDVCWPAACATDPVATGCGTTMSPCGICACEPSCEGKVCGDDPSDGCGGVCYGLCDDHEPGCTRNSDCPGGSLCVEGGGPRVGEPEGTNVCMEKDCQDSELQEPDCGSTDARCGTCPDCLPDCSGRECGLDPNCGVECGGSCGAGSYCDDSGQCQADSSDNETPITVPDGTGGTRDITPLDPPVANQVGATPGTFAVNENGDATYTVPIEVPPGRAGMMPELAIAYSSSGGNGLLGKGWSIQGLSAISRCPRTFARDGAPKAIQNDATDAYCLDGQRLVPLGGSDTDPVREYRTDVDSFSKIVSYGGNQLGPISFKVWTRDGRILSYGSTANSRLYTALQNSVRLWALDRVEDRAGNSTDVHYDKVERTVGGTLEMVPVRLAYGGNATLEHDRSVRLVYEKRPPEDVREGFSQGGDPYSLSKRLLRLETTVRSEVVRSYHLGYDQAPNGVSRLITIQECLPPASSPSCKPATQFTYHWEPYEFTNDAPVDGFEVALMPGVVLDADGDGDHDLKGSGLHYTGGYHNALSVGWTFAAKVTATVVLTYYGYGRFAPFANAAIDWYNENLGDPESNYIPPALYRATGDPSQPVIVERATDDEICLDESQTRHFGLNVVRTPVDVDGNGVDEVRALCNWHPPNECDLVPSRPDIPAFGPYGDWTPYQEWVTDLDGDGVGDHVRCEPTLSSASSNGTMSIALRNPNTGMLGGRSSFDVPRGICLPGCAVAPKRNPTLLLDVDGDGTQNLVFFDPGFFQELHPATGWQALVFRNGIAELQAIPNIPAPSDDHELVLADVNGDGLMDVVQLPAKIGLTEDTAVVALNTTSGFQSRRMLLTGDPSVAGSFRAWVFDYDGDGREDILHSVTTNPADHSGFWVARSLAGDNQEELNSIRIDYPHFSTPGIMADINGDGNADMLTAGGLQTLRIHYGHGNKNNLLTRVVDGIDRRIDIEYSIDTLQDSECETKFPVQCLPKAPRPLVSRYTESQDRDGLTFNENLYVFGYWSPRVGLGGHGWLGFTKSQVDHFRCGWDCDTSAQRVSSTIVEYEPPTPVEVEGGTIFPLARRVRERLVLQQPERSAIEDPETQGTYDSTSTFFDWKVLQSADGRPFPHLERVEWINLVGGFDGGGDAVSGGFVVNEVDDYGNIRRSFQNASGTTTRDVAFYPPDRDEWLISLPHHVTHSSERGGTVKNRYTTYTFVDGLLETVVIQPNDPNLRLTTNIQRDAFNNVAQVIWSDAHGNTRSQSFEYDSRGIYPLVSYNSRLHPTQYRYDERHGAVTLVADANGIATQYAYDGFGRLREVVAPDGRMTFEFQNASRTADNTLPVNASHKVVTTVNGLPDTEVEMDAFERPVRTKVHGYDGQVVIAENVYFGGLLARAARPHLEGQNEGYTEYSYDSTGRLVNITYPNGDTLQQLYANRQTIRDEYFDWALVEDADYVVATVAPSGSLDMLVTDQRGNPMLSFDAHGNRTSYIPGAFDVTRSIVDAAGNFTTIVSDDFGRTTTLRDPARGDNTFTYNAFGETTSHTDGNGALKEYFYDDLGRLERIEDTDGVTLFTYDGTGANAIGRLVSATSPDGHTTTLSYMPPETDRNRGLLESIQRTFQGETFTQTVEYDADSRVTALHYPTSAGSEFGISYHYNTEQGYLEEIRNAADGTPYWTYVSSYQGYRVAQDRLGSGAQTTRTFEPLTGRLQQLKTLVGSNTIHGVFYTYDANGNMQTRSDLLDARGTDTFVYDELDRLNLALNQRLGSGSTIEYAHDPIGNITDKGGIGHYDYTQPGDIQGYRLNSAGGNEYSHDNSGNIFRRTGDQVQNFTQEIVPNALDLPKTVIMPTVEQTIDFAYSAFGERVSKTTPTATTTYVGDDYRRVAPATSTSTEPTLHHYRIFLGPRQIAQVTRSEQDGVITAEWTQYLHHDAVGSVEVITDESGNVIHSQQFDPYGSVDTPGWDITGILAGFTGHEHDPDLGLVNMKGRLYDGALGRFISADPFVQYPLWSQGLNRYSYGFNNPMSGSDPSGFAFWDNDEFAIAAGWLTGGAFGAAHCMSNTACSGGGWSSAGAIADVAGAGYAMADAYASLHDPSMESFTSPANKEHVQHGRLKGAQGAQFGQTYNAATCGGAGEPTCASRPFGSVPMESLVIEFLNSTSGDPTMMGKTVAETIVDTPAPEHLAAIIRTGQGGYRLGPVIHSGPNWNQVDFDPGPLAKGDRVVGAIHSHPGQRSSPVVQSVDMDLPTARRLAARGGRYAFRQSYVVGPSGTGPHFGVVLFEPQAGNLGTLSQLTVGP